VFFFIFLLFPIVVLEHNIAEGPARGKLGSKNALCFDESFQTSQALHQSLNYDEGLLTPVFINNFRLHIKPPIDETALAVRKAARPSSQSELSTDKRLPGNASSARHQAKQCARKRLPSLLCVAHFI
jgi:hypothetical protein